jgi:hypothetical protein
MEEKYLRHSWVDSRLKIGPSSIVGNGVIAKEDIKEGEKLMVWGGVKVAKNDFSRKEFHVQSATPLDDEYYIARPISDEEESVDDYLNHSCDPSAWLVDEVTVVARRHIRAGEEITVDCATWDADEQWPYLDVGEGPCRCGKILCRNYLTPKDWMQPELQERYAGHFSPYIQAKIDLYINE